MGFPVLVIAVAALHAAFVAYVVFGGFLAVRRPAALVPHVLAVGWGLAGTLAPVVCPLTTLENALRRAAGWSVLPHGFVDHYVTGVVYPDRFAGAARVLAAAIVLASWWIAVRAWRASGALSRSTAAAAAPSPPAPPGPPRHHHAAR